MGSPLSPIVANIFMQHFENQNLQTAVLKPTMWLRYVDDTFVVWPHSSQDIQPFLQHLNSQNPDIKFTMEVEQQNSLPFLDVLVTKTPSGRLQHQVYRKPTHTDRYLNYRSFHHPSVTQSVSNSLVRRAYAICDETHLHQELKHVRRTLQRIGYPNHKINTARPTTTVNNSTEPSAVVTLPYIGAASYRLQRILRQVNIQTRFSSTTTLRSTLHTHKDKRPQDSQPGVYRIPCECGKVYIGETGRSFATRLKEHKAAYKLGQWEKSAIVKHSQEKDHRIKWDESQLIATVKQWHSRRIRESIEIKRHDTVPHENGI